MSKMASCEGFVEPLNLECNLINRFAGTTDIFFFLAFIVVAVMAAKFKMRTGPALLMFGLFGLIFSAFIPWFVTLVILIGGVTIFFGMSLPFTRG